MSDALLRKVGDYTVISVPTNTASPLARSLGVNGKSYHCILKYQGDEIATESGFANEVAAIDWAITAIEEHKQALTRLARATA